MDLKVGDIVELKSGGPRMTIAAVKADRAFCVWFNQRDQFHEEKTSEFLLETLTRPHEGASGSPHTPPSPGAREKGRG